MRKFYSILNVLVFCFVLYYITYKPTNENLKHAAVIMGGISILVAGYMGYLEYTDNSEEIRTDEMNKMKESYGSKISELLSRTEDYELKDKYLSGMKIENKELVEELSFTKNLIRKLNDKVSGSQSDKEINGQFVIPSKKFGIDTTRQVEKPNVDNNNTRFNDENYHFSQFGNEPVSQSIDGPPSAMNTTEVEPIDMQDRVNDYKNYNPVQKQSQPLVPDFLKPVETNPGRPNNNNNY